MTLLDTVGRRRVALVIIGVGISVLATILVTRDLDLGRTLRIAATAQPWLLAVTLGVIAVQAGLRALRWQLLLPLRDDGSRVSYSSALAGMLVGYLGNAVLPARLGEVVRSAVVARREGLASAEALGSAVLERVLDVFVLAILGVLAVTALAAPEWVGTAAATTAIAAAAALVLLGGGALIAARQRGRDATSSAAPGPARALLGTVSRLVVQLTRGARIVDRPGLIAAGIALTIVAWLLDASVFWLVGLSLGLAISPAGAMLVSALAVLSTAIPTAPGYVGTFELAAVVALGVSGVTGEPALAFAVLAHVMAVIPLSLAGTAALWLVGGTAARRGIGEQAPARH